MENKITFIGIDLADGKDETIMQCPYCKKFFNVLRACKNGVLCCSVNCGTKANDLRSKEAY